MSKSYLLGFHGWRWFGYTPSLMHWKVHTAKDGQFGACRSFRACLLLFQGPLPQNGFSEFYGISGCSNSSMIKISLVQSWFKTSALNSSKCIFIYWAYSNSILLETWSVFKNQAGEGMLRLCSRWENQAPRDFQVVTEWDQKSHSSLFRVVFQAVKTGRARKTKFRGLIENTAKEAAGA